MTYSQPQRYARSADLFEKACKVIPGGVNSTARAVWSGWDPHPLYVESGKGSHVTDVDGNTYVDLCLGDTGAMTGHAPPAAVAAMAAQAAQGTTMMLPTEDAVWVATELTRRFGLARWQFATSATDANRCSLRIARALTGRRKVLVFNYCYHGTVDETLATLEADGSVVPRAGHIGPQVDPAETTVVIEFHALPALEAALATREIACVLAEPAMTNIGIIHPDPGYHDALRRLTRETGTLLIIDETHTICTGPSGYTAAYGLEPDILTIGKPLAGGIPSAAYGLSAALAARIYGAATGEDCDVSGIGGTLAGNALTLAVMRATLAEVLTDEAYAHTIPLAQRWAEGVQGVIDENALPWSVTQLGARAEYWFLPDRPRDGGTAAAGVDHELDAFMHLYALNRGILLTPFHNMALMSPATTEADVDRHTDVFAEAVAELLT